MNLNKTIWLGDLDPWIDEKLIISLIGRNYLILLIVINDIKPNEETKSAYVEFISEEIALKVYNRFNSQLNRLTKRPIRILWGYDKSRIKLEEQNIKTFHKKKKLNISSNIYPNLPQSAMKNDKDAPVKYVNSRVQTPYSLYVGDLDLLVTEIELFEHFAKIYKDCVSCKLKMGVNGFNKGYGFVFFNSKEECERAKIEMRGSFLNGRCIKIGNSFNKEKNDQTENILKNSTILKKE